MKSNGYFVPLVFIGKVLGLRGLETLKDTGRVYKTAHTRGYLYTDSLA